MRPEILLVAGIAFVVSALLTILTCKLALLHGMIDTPNERSSHTRPMPRGGGVSIVFAATGSLFALSELSVVDVDLMLALGGGGLVVAIVGFLDDRQNLSVAVRLAAQLGAALWAIAWLGGLSPLRFGDEVVSFGWAGYVLGVLGIGWTLNLFNFMDGIDGIAASEAAFIACAGTSLVLVFGGFGAVSATALALGAACCGFLIWNWPPARIFMGDVGSSYLGFTIAVLAIAEARESSESLFIWLILGGVFFVDATVTLLRRMVGRERLYEAHRTHAYQRLARRWGSHRRVTLTVLAVNVFWLFPLAWLAARFPSDAYLITAIALAPLVALALAAGAGRSEIGN